MRVKRLLPILGFILVGCTVGPDYPGPPNAAPKSEAAPEFRRADATTPAAHPAAAWREFGDAEMTRLIELALADSPTIAAARGRVRQARAGLGGARAEALPTGNASAMAGRGRIGFGDDDERDAAIAQALTEDGQPPPNLSDHAIGNLYSYSFDASWEIDIFGGRRRTIARAAAQADAADAALADAQVQLAAEVAQTYVTLRADQTQMDVAQHSISLQEQTLALTRQRAAQGAASSLEVARLEATLGSTRADLPIMAGEIEATLDRLSTLCGKEPGAFDAELATPASVPHPPAEVAVGDPAGMLRRRPDIRRAERELAAANAAIGQSVAGYFPKVTLLGALGAGSTSTDNLLEGDSLSLFAGPMLQWRIFDFGRTAAQVEGAEAGTEVALATYRQRVLEALGDAEAALSRFRHLRRNLAQLEMARGAAEQASALARQSNRAGTMSLIDTLDIERQRLQADRAFVQGQERLTVAFIGLEKSLGLGWEDAP